MGFIKKLWLDRVVEHPMRRKLTDVDTGEVKYYDIERAEGTISEIGDAWSAENMNDLEDRIAGSINEMSMIADIETTFVASRSYTYGNCFLLDGILYRVIQPIVSGDAIEIGTNVMGISVVADSHAMDTSKRFLLSKSSWKSGGAEGSSGTSFYYDLAVNRIYSQSIIVKVAGANQNQIASAANRQEFAKIVDARADLEASMIRFFATAQPADLYVWIKGVA